MTAIWWQWLYSVPLPENPSFDANGKFASKNQPFDDLIFLCGTATELDVGYNVLGTATRSITVEAGTAFFFPLINSECDNVIFNGAGQGKAAVENSGPNSSTIPQLRAACADYAGSAYDLFCTLTSQSGTTVDVPFERVTSPVFPYFLPPDNIYEAYGQEIEGIVYPAVSDGYWSYIPPLRRGRYTLNFGGTTPNGTVDGQPSIFQEDITYYITVR